MEVLRKENEALKIRIQGPKKKKHAKMGVFSANEADANEVDRKKMYNELQSLTSHFEKMAK